ncbi:MAG: spermidine/putrescine ABC transporter substrate-binding protein [Pseudomonadota bacterium]
MPGHRTLRSRTFTASRRRFLQGSVAVATVLPAASRMSFAQTNQVNVYNWDTYIGENTVANFTKATGTDVRYDLFASNDELFAKLREGNPGYDVIFPSNDFVERLVAADRLIELDHSQLPNMSNLNPAFTDPEFDPGRKYSIPYFWGTIGIGYRKSATEGMTPTSWADMFASDQYAGRMSLLNDSDVIEVALKYLGLSLNSSDPAEIDAAAEALIKAKPNIKAFAPDTGQDLLIAGEVDVCMEWNGDILQVMDEDDDLAYVVPSEGSILWEDTMCIPKDGPNPEGAHAFVNYILEAEVHGEIASEIKYPCPNEAAMAFIPEEDRNNTSIYPSKETLERCEVAVFDPVKDDLKEKALTRVLAA